MNGVRLKRIRAVLKKDGPLTVSQIAELTGYSASNVAAIIYEVRKNPGKEKTFRKVGRTSEFGSMPRTLFEISDAPDSDICERTAAKLSREESQERRHLLELAKQIKPFRHWQDVAFFGEPSHALRV